MNLKFACLAALGAAVFALPAAAHTGGADLDCPYARAAESAAALDLQMKTLNSQLERMNEVLAREQAARDEVMGRIKDEVEEAVHTARLDPAQVDALVQRAVVQAEASAQAARQAELAIQAIEPRLEALEQKLDALHEQQAQAADRAADAADPADAAESAED